MLKKLEPLQRSSARYPFKPLGILLLSLFMLGNMMAQADSTEAQSGELKQKIAALKSDKSEKYEVKFLNIADQDVGAIDKSFYKWKDKFLLKSHEKVENNLGNRGYEKFYINVYAFETLKDRQYALSDWMENFLEGREIRAGRMMRTYDYASPTIILINDLEVILLTYQCSDYSEDNFDQWKDDLLQYFGQDNTMVIEVLCGGPLEWTKNPPDPRKTRGLF